MVPHVAVCETHQWSLEFSFFNRKRLSQDYLHFSDIAALANVRFAPTAVTRELISFSVFSFRSPAASASDLPWSAV
jgi:hypothetical protein